MGELIKSNEKQQFMLSEAIEMLEELHFHMGMFQNQRFKKLKSEFESCIKSDDHLELIKAKSKHRDGKLNIGST